MRKRKSEERAWILPFSLFLSSASLSRNYDKFSFAARCSNQRALINRELSGQMTRKRRAASFVIRPRSVVIRCAECTRLCTCSILTRVDVLKVTLVCYLDSLSYPSFRPAYVVGASTVRAERSQIILHWRGKSAFIFARSLLFARESRRFSRLDRRNIISSSSEVTDQ